MVCHGLPAHQPACLGSAGPCSPLSQSSQHLGPWAVLSGPPCLSADLVAPACRVCPEGDAGQAGI